MITEIGRKTYITTFKHVRPNPETQVLGGTYAYIKIFDLSLKDEEREVVAVGYAQLYYKDKDFNKQVGRKWALQYALGLNKIALKRQQGKGHKPQESIYSTEFPKEFRQTIWTSYWKSHRMGPLNKVSRLKAKIAELQAASLSDVKAATSN